jgi:hypothetical protein
VLVLSTPAGIERFVRDGSVPATSATLPPPDTPRPTPERLEQIFRTHRQVNLGMHLCTITDLEPVERALQSATGRVRWPGGHQGRQAGFVSITVVSARQSLSRSSDGPAIV